MLPQKQMVTKLCLEAKYLVLNADSTIPLEFLEKEKMTIITYGLNQKSTVTISSINEENALIALQRSFINIEGEEIEMGEKSLELDENHKWGKYPLHYLSEYYDYGYQAMKIVASEKSLECEKQSLSELKKSCETEMLKKYYPAVSNTLEDYFAKTALAERMTKYVSYFKELLLDETKKQAVLNYFLINKINCCAFYGASEVARFLVVFLKKFLPQIKIDFIVEDTSEQNYKGVPFIKRNSTFLPKTDVIIIADMIYTEAVYKKLQKMGLNSKLTDVFEIANVKHA